MNEQARYLRALQEADPRAATAAMHDALRRGVTPQQWIRDVVVPAQTTVGERWYDESWSIADEHAATAVAERALALLHPLQESPPRAEHVVFACAEGEWHAFPARLASELALTTGLRATCLGAGVPVQDLSRRLAGSLPDVLALSCTMPTNLIGAWRSIAAAHELGIPVVVGGRAWGDDDRRAKALGADLLLDDPSALATQTFGAIADPVALPAEALLLETPDPDLLRLALERQTVDQQLSDFRRTAALDELSCLVRHAAAATATGDPTIVRDQLSWLSAQPARRSAPPTALLDSCRYLADVLEPRAPLAAGVLRSCADEAAAHGRSRSRSRSALPSGS